MILLTALDWGGPYDLHNRLGRQALTRWSTRTNTDIAPTLGRAVSITTIDCGRKCVYAWRGGLVVDGVADDRVRGCEGCVYIYDLIGYLLYLTGWLMAYCMVDSVVLCLAAGPVSAARGPLRRGAPAPNLSHSVPAVPRKSSLQVRITKSASTDRGPLFFMLSLDTFGTLRGDIGDKKPARNNTPNQVISGSTASTCPLGTPLYLLESKENGCAKSKPDEFVLGPNCDDRSRPEPYGTHLDRSMQVDLETRFGLP